MIGSPAVKVESIAPCFSVETIKACERIHNEVSQQLIDTLEGLDREGKAMRPIKDLDDAIDEQGDLVRELERTPECAIRAEEAQNVLNYMQSVRVIALKYKDLARLLDVK